MPLLKGGQILAATFLPKVLVKTNMRNSYLYLSIELYTDR